jgi:prepilin-type N-terminal cleavage/methylation domain-containing protein
MTSRVAPSGDTAGFTLIEIMVALVLLSFGAVVLGKSMFLAARTAQASANTVYRTAAISTEMSRLDAVPFDSLAAGTTCVTVSTPPFPHTRCTTVNNVSSKTRQVIVVVTPSGNSLLRPDTTIVVRTKSNNGQPLNN